MRNADSPTLMRWPLWWLGLIALALFLFLLVYPDDRSRMLLATTFRLAATAATISVPIGTVVAWQLMRTNTPCRLPIVLGIGLGMVIPLYMHAAAWEAGFGRLGWYSEWQQALGTRPWLSGFRGALWVHTLAAIPWVVAISCAQLALTNPELESAARIDTNALSVFRHISLVQIGPAIVLAWLWVFIWVSGEITATDLFQVRTFAEETYIGFALDTLGDESKSVPSFAAGAALVALLLVLSVIAIRIFLPCIEFSADRCVPRLDLGWGRWPALFLEALLLVVLLAVPLANLCIKAGWVYGMTPDQPPSWSLTKLLTLTLNSLSEQRAELGWSLLISQASAAAAVTIGLVLAFLAIRSTSMAAFVLLLIAACLCLPGPVIGLAIIRLFSALPGEFFRYLYSRTIAAPWLALTLRCLPWAMMLIWMGLRRSQREWFETAQLAGATPRQQLLRVALPTNAAVLLVALLVGVTYNLGDLATTILAVPPGVSTLSIRIFGLIHYGVEDRLAATCLAVISVYVLMGTLVVTACQWLRS